MNCDFIKNNAEEYIKEGFLKADIEKHLEICPSCREYIIELKELFSSYPDFEKDFKYPKNLEEKIKNSLKNIEKAHSLWYNKSNFVDWKISKHILKVVKDKL